MERIPTRDGEKRRKLVLWQDFRVTKTTTTERRRTEELGERASNGFGQLNLLISRIMRSFIRILDWATTTR